MRKLIIGIAEDGIVGVTAEGFSLPADVVIIERDYTRGNVERDGLYYEDREVAS